MCVNVVQVQWFSQLLKAIFNRTNMSGRRSETFSVMVISLATISSLHHLYQGFQIGLSDKTDIFAALQIVHA